MIDEAIRRGDIKLAPASEKHVKMANDVQNDFYNKLIGLGMNEQEALSTSILMKNFALKRTVSPERFKDWYDKIVVTDKPQSQVGAVMQNALHQSAMYKSPKQNFSDFYNQVFEKEKDAKKNNTNLKKSYFEYNDENTNIRVPHDTIVHDNNKHNLSSSEWETLFNNLTNPSLAVLSNKPRFNGTPVLLKYNIANKSYGVVVEFFENKKPIITTAFTDKEKNIDNWLKKNSHSQAKNTSSVTTKGMLLSNDYTNIINYVKEKLNPNVNNHEDNQSNKESIEETIQDKFGCSVEELTENIKQDIISILSDYDVSDSEFSIQDIRIYGSYSKGTNKETSDLDFIVQYEGSMREDSAFNILHDVEHTIEDKDSNKVLIDINPINVNQSGTIDEHVAYMNSLNENTHFQSANTAGANENEISDAQREWEEKGTDSKYFKKWFGDSKVVDESGKPLVVYHGTESDKQFEIFETGKPDGTEAIYFSSDKKTANSYSATLPVYEVFLKIENPFIVNAQGQEYNNFTAEIRSNLDWAIRNGHDGVIIKNIRDGWSQNKGGKVADTYVVFSPEQIKSVNNQGTFDAENPNIYYQGANTNYREQLEDTKVNFESFDELQEAFKNEVEQTPEDYKINNLEDALKDLDITENKPKEVKTPFETIQVRARNIEHIINSESDKLRYKSINRMFATLERPNIITLDEQGKRAYFKIFENNKENKKQIVYVSTDEQGNFVLTTIPIKRNKKFINAINKGNIVYDSRKGVINNSPDTNSITDVDTDFNPDINILFQSVYHGTPHKFDEFSLDAIGTGEGAQAHGWGLYFAGNKDVSENYRKELARINNLDLFGSVPVDVYYDGKHATEYNPSADFSLALELVGTQDKKAGIDYLKNEINKCQKRIDEFKEDMKQRPMDTPAFKQQIEDEQDYISELNKQIDFINNLDVNKLEVEKRNQGQLFEVDIPESDVLLDEDKTFFEQPENIQDTLKQILFDEKFSEYWQDFESAEEFAETEINDWKYGFRGGNIYDRIARLLGSEKDASLLLNEYGIKGITYNGYEDGRCYVIFDDKAVNVIKTYYQSANNNAVDLTNDFDKTPTLEEVKNYINEIVENGTKFATLSPDWFVDIKGGSRTKGKILNKGNYKKLGTAAKNRHNKYIMSLEKLLANAEYVGEKENTKQDKKPFVKKYHYFKTNIKIGDKTYQIVFDTEEHKNNSQSVDYANRSYKKHSENTNSITDNSESFNPKTVHLYNITEYKGNTYYQSDSEDAIREKLSNENIQNKIDELSQRIEKLAEEESELDNSLLK